VNCEDGKARNGGGEGRKRKERKSIETVDPAQEITK